MEKSSHASLVFEAERLTPRIHHQWVGGFLFRAYSIFRFGQFGTRHFVIPERMSLSLVEEMKFMSAHLLQKVVGYGAVIVTGGVNLLSHVGYQTSTHGRVSEADRKHRRRRPLHGHRKLP